MGRAQLITAVGLAALLGRAQAADIHILNGLKGADLGRDQSFAIDVFVDGPDTLACDGDIVFGESRLLEGVPAGTYALTVHESDPALDKCAGDLLLAGVGHVAASETAIFVAHLDPSGAPLISKFSANVDPVAPGDRTRVTPHHTAEAPELDVRYREVGASSRVRGVGAKGLRNGDQGFPDILDGGLQYEVLVSETPRLRLGFKPPIPNITPRFLLEEEFSNLFFVVGSLANGTLDVVQLAIEVGSAP
jgi:hypothetical protein